MFPAHSKEIPKKTKCWQEGKGEKSESLWDTDPGVMEKEKHALKRPPLTFYREPATLDAVSLFP
ncbi:hypothetical protein BRE01_24890 [Brevibacillus reuszeri]|uniref:Uncharacterized protein n=1 Tax=Brevibacillus reuszeri TaxID=54915 RepID=A0ABQ0TN09_9BACL|nr:hypothetical protein BRE01_24890 [Brevibacillus reuszeri]